MRGTAQGEGWPARWLETHTSSSSASLKRTHTSDPERCLNCVLVLFSSKQSCQYLRAKQESTVTSCGLTNSCVLQKEFRSGGRNTESLGSSRAWNIHAFTAPQFHFGLLWPIFLAPPPYISNPYLWYEKSPSSENLEAFLFLEGIWEQFPFPDSADSGSLKHGLC